MADFFIMIARFFVALWRSIKREPDARAVFITVILLLLSGVLFFMEVEHWRWLDALWYCVVTLTTVGSGDFVPHTDAGKIFTIIYIFMGLGVMLAAVRILAKHALTHTDSPFKKIHDLFKKPKQ